MKLNWRESLTPALKMASKIVILGIGSPLNSDDAAAILLIEELSKKALDDSRVLLIAGSSAPENFTSVIADFAPALLVAVDAARLGLAPGQVALLEKDELDGIGFSTHMLPFSIMLKYLQQRGLSNVELLGIEPASTEFGLELSAAVVQAVREITDFFTQLL
ncbi:MAG: hydrogenase 3 maturation endopeptidase HyCI [Clostridiales bacterium]|nr:hydrogenase 3 maturation endopeptidase HyCI [Clostridiales bacterium]